MNNIIYTISFICFSVVAIAQKNTIPTGGDANGTGGPASFSVGQIDYINNSGTNGSESQRT